MAGTNKYDVEIENRRLRWAFWMTIGRGIANALTIAAVSLVMVSIGREIIEPLAGKNTTANINVNLVLSITFAASVSVNIFQALRGADRKRTILEQRMLLGKYEDQLGLPTPEERRRKGRRTL